MSLPKIKINFLNGQLGTVEESSDGLLALVIGAVAVADKFNLNTPYTVTSVDDIAELGITAENNSVLYKRVIEFYNEAETGTKLVLYAVAPTSKMSDICDYTKTDAGNIRDLITKENGALRAIVIGGINTASTDECSEGLDADVYAALPKAQQLAEWATTELYAPLFFVLEGQRYDCTKTLKDLTSEKYNRCCILIGDEEISSAGSCIGTIAGRIASVSVQRNIGRVKDGSLYPTSMFVGAKKVEECESLIGTIYDSGYIVPRRYVGRAGYYFADDQMCCVTTDDYAHITSRRVIDKAYRLAYNNLLDNLLDELELNSNGTLQSAVAKSWQQSVENSIKKNMTAQGELSSNDDDDGCECYIDPDQNVVSNSTINIVLKVRPHGYSRFINVELGFQVTTE